MIAKPFVKWAGGKSQLLKQFEEYFPTKFNNYIEPFVGGGAVFFRLFSTGRLDKRRKALLIDSNDELINAYKTIKTDATAVIDLLIHNGYKNEKEVFLEVRKNVPIDTIERAARLIYLNKTCYNGLYRVNKKNEFNAPFGRYKNPKICDFENLSAISASLKYANILEGDFTKCYKYAKKGDFIYFDPPYQPISSTSSFTNYTKSSFTWEDQERLADLYKRLDKLGCLVMLSNSENKKILKLYCGYKKSIVKAKRMINCQATKRGPIKELIITNY